MVERYYLLANQTLEKTQQDIINFLTSMGIGMVINHDNIYDDTDNYGYQWSLNLRNFPDTPSGIGKDISNVRFFSGATLIKPDKTPLVSDTINNIEVLAFANTTSYDEDDTPEGLTHVGTGYWTYSYRSHPDGSAMPAMAVQIAKLVQEWQCLAEQFF